MTHNRDDFLNDLKVVLRKHMKPDMSAEEVAQVHLDAVEWLSLCLAVCGVSRNVIRLHADRGERAGRQIR